MRYVFGVVFVCALSIAPTLGCPVEMGELCLFPPCPNGHGCPACDGVVCEDDGNECTLDVCSCDTGDCGITGLLDGLVCRPDESAGVCVDGVCQEDIWCGGACDDGNECTLNLCYLDQGTCDEEVDLVISIGDGTVCSGGFCRDEVCVTLLDQCTADDLAAIESGDEPDAYEIVACRDEWNDVGGGEEDLGCMAAIPNCLQESGTSLSAECSNCFALRECCMIYACGCESPEPRCDQCVEETCEPLVDACIGGQ
jgi:hypothetical protein